MRENKRKREAELNCSTSVDQSSYPNESASMAFRQVSLVEENVLSHQTVVGDSSAVQNQQTVYQIQKVCDQDQNLVYFLVPANENVQVPLPVLTSEQSASDNSIVYNTNTLNAQEISELPLYVQHIKDEPEFLSITDNQIFTVKGDHSKEITQINNVGQSYNQIEVVSGVQEQPNVSNTPKLQYRCTYKDCNQIFFSLYDRKTHMDNHVIQESTSFKCSLCNMVFDRAIDRNKHIETHSIAPTYKCKGCQKEFAYFTILIKHLKEKKYSTRNPFVCYFCDAKITDFSDLVKHHQLNMKQCDCGVKRCGTQIFQMHICRLNKNKEYTQIPVAYEKKKLKTKK